MKGAAKDSRGRQNNCKISLRNNSAGFLLSRLLNLANAIDVSYGLLRANDKSQSYISVMLATNEKIELQKKINEFIGLLYYIQSKYGGVPPLYKNKIDRLKVKLGFYSI